MLTESKETVRSIKRAFLILEYFSESQSKLSIGELSQLTKLNKTTIFRILTTLLELGYIRQDSLSQKYYLSWNLHHLVMNYFRNVDMKTMALPFMKVLSVKVNETVGLNTTEGCERFCIEMVESRELVRGYINVGERNHLYLGAAGRIMIPYLTEETQRKVILEAMQLFNIDEKSMNQQLEEIRLKGYEISIDELKVGVFSVSAPIFDHTSQLAGSINICGPVQRYKEENIPFLTDNVKSTALQISKALGYVQREKLR